MLRAGELRNRITLQRCSAVVDPQWGSSPAYTTYGTAWASVLPTQGIERLADEGVQGSTSYTVRMRYRSDVVSTDRILFRGRVLDLVSVLDPDGKRHELQIEAREHAEAVANV